MTTMTASYSPEDNKLRLYTASRLDKETYDRVKAAGFGWAPRQELFVAPMWTPARADLLIELCGEIGDEDTSLVDRAEERSERFEEYGEHRAEDAESARAAVARIADGIPLGQPILVGHHSERHARKDAERIENGMRKAVKMWETSKYWERRAAGALRHAKYKELPGVRQRRIKGLEADKRKHERRIALSETFSKMWSAPGELTRERALKIVNFDHGSPWGTWSALDKGELEPEAAREVALACHERTSDDARRWIAHIDLRLAYERAMLGDVPAPSKPTRRALAPMANYPGEGFWHLTKAEYAKMHKDYKGTRDMRGARVRVAMRSHGLSAVYLTDSKRVDPPSEGSDIPDRFRPYVPAPRPVATSLPKPEAPNPYDAMKASLKAGVKVVSAPQLFPTPAAIAKRMVEAAEIGPEHLVLEPSAGLGALASEALRAGARMVTTYEINEACCEAIRRLPYENGSLCPTEPCDFLLVPSRPRFDRIVMNPPFADGQDIAHIRHALTFLKPGGRLVALCANGPRQNKILRPIVEEMGGTWEALPEGSFAEQGTSVRVAMLVVNAEKEATQ